MMTNSQQSSRSKGKGGVAAEVKKQQSAAEPEQLPKRNKVLEANDALEVAKISSQHSRTSRASQRKVKE